MELEQKSHTQPAWQDALSPGLIRRLMRPLNRPGVIAPQLARGILTRMQHTGSGLPLLARMLQHLGAAEDIQAPRGPIVYARPGAATSATDATAEAPAMPAADAAIATPAPAQAAATTSAAEAPAEAPAVAAAHVAATTTPLARPAERPVVRARAPGPQAARTMAAASAMAPPPRRPIVYPALASAIEQPTVSPAAPPGAVNPAPPDDLEMPPAPIGEPGRIVLPPGRLRRRAADSDHAADLPAGLASGMVQRAAFQPPGAPPTADAPTAAPSETPALPVAQEVEQRRSTTAGAPALAPGAGAAPGALPLVVARPTAPPLVAGRPSLAVAPLQRSMDPAARPSPGDAASPDHDGATDAPPSGRAPRPIVPPLSRPAPPGAGEPSLAVAPLQRRLDPAGRSIPGAPGSAAAPGMGGAAAPPEGPRPTWPGRQGGAPPGLPAVARIDSVAVQRFPDGPATGGEAPLAPPPAPAASAEAGAAVDIDELVDRALRKLMRQIDIESERRGRAPWA